MIKNKKDKRIKGKFSNIIIRNYIVFSVLLVVLLFCVLYVVVNNLDSFDRNNKIAELSQIYKQDDISDYQDTKVDAYVGKDGYVEVLDSKGKIVYSSKSGNGKVRYSKVLIKMIPDSKEEKYVSHEIIKQGKNKGDIIVYGDTYTSDALDIDSETDVVDVDDNNAIVFSTAFPKVANYTDTEFKYLKTLKLNGYKLAKTTYTSKDGNKYTIIGHMKKGIRIGLGKKDTAFLAIGIGFAGIYILMLILFALWISRSVKKPLAALEKGMLQVSGGQTGKLIDYSGPREFVEICDNFNAMSTTLYESELRNQRLQDENHKMVSDISHDLKTPITVIQGYSKAIADGMVKPEEQEKYLKIISSKAEALTELINEMHDYAKMDHPDFKYDMKPVDICEYTREYFADRFDELDIGGYKVEAEIPDKSIIVNLDISKFNRVYANLISNFMKYNKPGKTIFCIIEYDDRSVTIKVGDNGVGIPKKIKRSVFEPFAMGEKSRTTGGSGLGLPMVRKIVSYHNGTIDLMDKPDSPMKVEFAIRLLRI